MSHETFTPEDLITFKPKHDSFVGIDSDGCVFGTMELKQKACFHTKIIEHWHLETIEKPLREAAEFSTLYSQSRGRNRFILLADVINLLRDCPDVLESGVTLPEFKSLQKWLNSGAPLGNPTLEEAIDQTDDEELKDVLNWSLAVNDSIAETIQNMPPFKGVKESLEKITASADAIVVSQTATEVIVREWNEHNIRQFVEVIAGQELGTKAEHLRMATDGKYDKNNILMIGDAPGDESAAKEVGIHFFPINPGHEEESWDRFYNESYDKFLNNEFGGKYADDLSKEFNVLLPSTPPWK